MQNHSIQPLAVASLRGIKFPVAASIQLLLSVFLCAQLCACQNQGEAVSPNQKIAPGEPASPAPVADKADAENAVGAKLQEYVTCYNRIDESAHSTITRYASWVQDMSAGPTGKEMNIYGLYSLDGKGIAKCKATFEKVAKQEPSIVKLDSAALAYGDAIAALDKAVEAVYSYYDREDYKDDNFAKGKQLHAPLAESMHVFETASDNFSNELNAENDRLLEAELVKIEKTEGRKLPYLHASMMLEAKKLVHIIEAANFSADIAALKLTDYEKMNDEAVEFTKQNAGSGLADWSSVARAAEDFRKAAKERVRRIRDKTPYSEGEKMMLKPGSAWMVEGSQEKVVTAYNKLIEASNNLR